MFLTSSTTSFASLPCNQDARANYLPTQSSMPTLLALSSGPLDLTSIPAVMAFITNTSFTSKSVTSLPGGTVNILYQIHLLVPYEGSQTVIFTHAQMFVKDWMDAAVEMDCQVRARITRAVSSWEIETPLCNRGLRWKWWCTSEYLFPQYYLSESL